MGRWAADWPDTAHFIGVGGVAMSGLATLLAQRGVRVRGSDQAVYAPASEVLAAAGIEVRTPYAAANLDPVPELDLVVVGNAVSRGNPELERALDERLPMASLAEVVERLLVPGRRVSVVAGTHGKTTTSSLLAWLHHAAGRDPSFLVGGRPGNFPHGGQLGRGEDLVLEGDEYDTAFFDKGPKFLHYWPQVAVIGAVEFDHADIYADLAAVERAFALLVRMVPASGLLAVPHDDSVARRLAAAARCRVATFGLSGNAELAALERSDGDDGQRFVVSRGGRVLAEARLALPGPHNAKNALAALLAAEAAGLPIAAAAPHLATWIPPRRRLELTGRGDGVAAYDDFAHHPTAIAHTLATLRGRVPPGGRLVACFEPRSNTMVRKVFEGALVEALAQADVVWLGAVDRPERFHDDERLDVATVVARLRAAGRRAEGPLSPEAILAGVRASLTPGDVVVVMSNGAFGGLAPQLGAAVAGREGA
ncbi:MAG: Mur ligase family protein [Acidobacteria bacterium]|jgi:UDP-N-acetylmuramate: L-alanyl-gamma-D-glutamyl-meso-diaminopimelate ligase|nr:Mur ligase family protein [Acidobacteriota bacterium]